MRIYMAERRARVRAEMIAYLGGQCFRCDATDDLDFDHKNPQTKLFPIASGLDRSRAELLAEVDKCQLLCRVHHLEKTREDGPQPNRACGERVGSARLLPEDVLAIRQLKSSGRTTAAMFGVSRKTVQDIRARRTWAHI